MARVKVLYDHDTPFLLAHGGFQVQIEQTVAALRKLGVEMEPVRWWDEDQRGDIIHYFGRPGPGYSQFAVDKGFKLVISPLLTGVGSRTKTQLWAQRQAFNFARKLSPRIAHRLSWDAFQLAHASIALTAWEAHLMHYIFGAPRERLRVVPNGIEDAFLNSTPRTRGKWLVCTATITDRKRVVELAEAAVQAQTPVWIVGNAYSENDPYAQKFFRIAKANPALVRFEGAIRDRAKLAEVYREARGFVLLSSRESLSISALEAAACECPLLLSDLPWATTTFKENARYCRVAGTAITAKALREFYDAAPTLAPPAKPRSWFEIGAEVKLIYEALLASTSR